MAKQTIEDFTSNEYKYGFSTDVETEVIPIGLNEDVVRLISKKKNEPEWLLDFRLKAFALWQKSTMPTWAKLNIPPIDYQAISYYAAPRKNSPKSLDEVDEELLKTFDKLGVPLHEQKMLTGMAVDAVMDSVSVKTTYKDTLAEKGIIFCSISEADKTVSGYGSPLHRQLFRLPQFGCFLRRLVRLYSQRRPLPYGAVYIFSYKCNKYRAV